MLESLVGIKVLRCYFAYVRVMCVYVSHLLVVAASRIHPLLNSDAALASSLMGYSHLMRVPRLSTLGQKFGLPLLGQIVVYEELLNSC